MPIIDIVVLAVIVACAIGGYRSGLILSVCSLVVLFLAIIVTQTCSPVVSRYVQNNEKCYNYVSSHIEKMLSVDQMNEEQIVSENNVEKEKQHIERLLIPKSMKKILLENNNKQSYEAVGVNSFKKYVSSVITITLINCICYIVVFLAAVFVLKFLVRTLDLVSHLPVIHTLNKLGGFLAGGIKGIIFIWFFYMILIICSGTDTGHMLVFQVQKGTFSTFLYDNNLLLNALIHVVKILL